MVSSGSYNGGIRANLEQLTKIAKTALYNFMDDVKRTAFLKFYERSLEAPKVT